MAREQFASRLGFILMAAGCAIGLGNVWRFPYVTGKYGGALFVLIYLLFLIILGFPIMVAELAIGRGGQNDLPSAMKTLRQSGFRWEIPAVIAFTGNLVLLMFYSVVTGWVVAYTWYYLIGMFSGVSDFGKYFGSFVSDWASVMLFTGISILMMVIVCAKGVRSGIERVIKGMMAGLFLLQFIIIALILTFPGAMDGIKYFLLPDVSKIQSAGLWNTIYVAMNQSFFTLSLGIGSIAICGSYTGKDRSLASESALIIVLDTIAALASGLIIFSACFAFGIQPDAGPGLIFVTLPKAFAMMPCGRWIGLLFFLFLSAAALSTLIAVSENVIAYSIGAFKLSRIRASAGFGILLMLISLPCIFGFSIWKSFEPLGKGTNILDLEDFIISSNLLPLGSVLIVLFCTMRSGWGRENFLKEVNTGSGMRFPPVLAAYIRWIVPLLVLCLWGYEIYQKFF